MVQPFSFSILLPVYRESAMRTHGDFYFGSSLADALERLGHQTKVLAGESWGQAEPNDITLVLRGRNAPKQKLGRLMFVWCISFPPKMETGEFEIVDHFFAASPALHKRISRIVTHRRSSVMYQAFDRTRMFPETVSPTNDLVFVGSPRAKDRRPVVSYASASGLPTGVWGQGWDETEYRALHMGGHVANADLGDVYRSGKVVLNDHLVVMKRNAIISNRVYDALACGRAVLTDSVAGMPEDLLPYVYHYSDAKDFKTQAVRALAETIDQQKARITFAQQMQMRHSFDQRAEQICGQVEKLSRQYRSL